GRGRRCRRRPSRPCGLLGSLFLWGFLSRRLGFLCRRLGRLSRRLPCWFPCGLLLRLFRAFSCGHFLPAGGDRCLGLLTSLRSFRLLRFLCPTPPPKSHPSLITAALPAALN